MRTIWQKLKVRSWVRSEEGRGNARSGEMSSNAELRKWRVGKMHILWVFQGGAVWIIGPHWPFSLVMGSLILVSSGFFSALFIPVIGTFHKVVFVILVTTVFCSFVSTVIRDPGISRSFSGAILTLGNAKYRPPHKYMSLRNARNGSESGGSSVSSSSSAQPSMWGSGDLSSDTDNIEQQTDAQGLLHFNVDNAASVFSDGTCRFVVKNRMPTDNKVEFVGLDRRKDAASKTKGGMAVAQHALLNTTAGFSTSSGIDIDLETNPTCIGKDHNSVQIAEHRARVRKISKNEKSRDSSANNFDCAIEGGTNAEAVTINTLRDTYFAYLRHQQVFSMKQHETEDFPDLNDSSDSWESVGKTENDSSAREVRLVLVENNKGTMTKRSKRKNNLHRGRRDIGNSECREGTMLISDGTADVNRSRNEEAGSMICPICNIRVPADTVHCEECDVCIDRYDHHCPWTSKCVGKGNIVPFYVWIISSVATFGYLAILGSVLGDAVKGLGLFPSSFF